MMNIVFLAVRQRLRLSLIWAGALIFGLGTAAHANQANPLFSSDEVIKIQLRAPFSTLTRKAKRNTDPYDATLTLVGNTPESHSISLAARGKSRRRPDICKFPPLRVKFQQKPNAPSLFAKQKGLKLVTHCQAAKGKQKYALLEYTAYRLFNVLTPESLRVRMAEIEYIEAKSGKVITTRYGFFIEDTDDAAKRNGMKELDRPSVQRTQLSVDGAARYSLYQYMIGNLDWSMGRGPTGQDCCHNTKLLGTTKTSATNFKPVPYDFDFSGLVNAPYAEPPDSIKINSVTSRYYRGLCIHNDAVRRQAIVFQKKRPELERAIMTVPALSDKDKAKTRAYLDSFFKTLSDPKKFDSRILNKCRT